MIVDKGRKVQIVKRMSVGYSGPRCKDCRHCKEGRKTLFQQWYDSHYCDRKPKTIGGYAGYFYSARTEDRACKMYEP